MTQRDDLAARDEWLASLAAEGKAPLSQSYLDAPPRHHTEAQARADIAAALQGTIRDLNAEISEPGALK